MFYRARVIDSLLHTREKRELKKIIYIFCYFQLQNASNDKAGMTFYEIPPTPKPFSGKYLSASGYSPSPGVPVARDLDPRQTQSPARADDEHYIAFPPSGLPVYGIILNLI